MEGERVTSASKLYLTQRSGNLREETHIVNLINKILNLSLNKSMLSHDKVAYLGAGAL